MGGKWGMVVDEGRCNECMHREEGHTTEPVSIVVKRHCNCGDSYKGKHLTGADLQVQRF